MKKIFLILISFVLVANVSTAQRRSQTIKWFSLAAKAGIGNSIFLNTDLIKDSNVGLNYFNISQSYGGRFTFSYGENLGFGSDVLFSTYGQEYTINNIDTIRNINVVYDKKITIKTIDIVPFFRYSGSMGGYVEIGGKFSTITSVSESNSISENFINSDVIASYYEPKFTSVIFGFGTALYKTERIDINIGARIAYSFTDINPNRNFNVVNDGFYVPDYTITNTTNPFSVQAILEVNYFFAFWGDASCGRGRFMLFQ